MAGANGVPKYPLVDREGSLTPLRHVGEPLNTRVIALINAASPSFNTISGLQMLNDILFDGTTAAFVTGPSAQQVFDEMGQVYLNMTPTTWHQLYENPTGAPITVNLGAGFSPAFIVIPANTVSEVTWEISSVNPAGIRQLNVQNSGAGTGSGTVTSITAGAGITLTPNPITTTGTVSITNSVVPASHTWANITYNAQGEITAASDGTLVPQYGLFTTPSPATGPGATIRTQLSFLSMNILAAPTAGAGSDVSLSLSANNDPTSFQYPGTGGPNTFNILVAGPYHFDIYFAQELGESSSWGITFGAGHGGFTTFGAQDTVATAPPGRIGLASSGTVNFGVGQFQLTNTSVPSSVQTPVNKVANPASIDPGLFSLFRLA